MTTENKPARKPSSPFFSSGPTAKRPGWTVQALENAVSGRSHRSAPGKEKLKAVIDRHRRLLKIPDDYRIGIVPASDTGAVEMALWSLLGSRGVDILAWEAFSMEWLKDVAEQLKLPDVRAMTADYGRLPDLTKIDGRRDAVFVWNGTTSGVCVPDGDWIPDDRTGLTICDATSAVFAFDLPWKKLDVVTWSWQKVLGGEAAHGMIALSPRAAERLQSYTPPWPMPKIFRMAEKGKIIEGIFKGDTINTPSLLAVEDCLDALKWVESIGGLEVTIARSRNNLKAIERWVEQTPWIDFLASDPSCRSPTSICLKITGSQFNALTPDAQQNFIKTMTGLLEKEQVAYDIAGHRDAPANLRIWGGTTVETSDIESLLPWLGWAYAETCRNISKKAA